MTTTPYANAVRDTVRLSLAQREIFRAIPAHVGRGGPQQKAADMTRVILIT
jgi:hypothetical protein